MDSPLLLLDETQCVECDICSLACSLVKSGLANIKISRVRSLKQWPEYPSLNVCKHWRCDSKTCIDACPTEAIELDEGVLFIDPNLCNGCGECVPACPYDAIHISELDWKAFACDLCSGAPACAPACPTDAIVFEGDNHVY